MIESVSTISTMSDSKQVGDNSESRVPRKVAGEIPSHQQNFTRPDPTSSPHYDPPVAVVGAITDGQEQNHYAQVPLAPYPPQITPMSNLMLPLQQQMLLAAAAVAQSQPSPQMIQAALKSSPGVGIHNLIPAHLQASALAASLHGTPGHGPALILPNLIGQTTGATALSSNSASTPPLMMLPTPAMIPCLPPPIYTVQDRPLIPPVFNGVNPNYPGLRLLNTTPPVYVVENFLTCLECDLLILAANDSWSPAPVVGKGAGEISPSRTSSTCYLAREDLPDYLRKVSILTGKPIEHCELPQVGRYLPSQQYLQHFDAFDLSTEDGCRFAANGGQRVVTVLIYLNDVPQGGATAFPTLNLQVQPRKGMALVFFPATVDGLLDRNALHAAQPAMEPFTKYVSQVWIRQGSYTGHPSKRLPQPLGVPFNHTEFGFGGAVDLG